MKNGIITGYYVGYKISAVQDKLTLKKVEESSNEHQSTYITGLQPLTEYDIVIRAYNSAGTGPESSPIMGKTLETGENLTEEEIFHTSREVAQNVR
ncbi:hypothetical protein AVEN_28734-1 [Araneus ventricosus]|uniref:Fibronectin type-III domain-containing protein n=1 Tax=Araneus ventricosus TaxID=182803 RepID=A0A4Y2VZG9_ARAVE|nr:hypothetical protein AVEN_28734-1 [Araneus ventricosus]